MVKNYSELIFLTPWIVILIIILTLYIQGWMVLHEKHGYQENPKVKKHPEILEIKGDTIVLMSVKFTEEDLKELQEMVLKQKMEELFEEPSTYEDDENYGME